MNAQERARAELEALDRAVASGAMSVTFATTRACIIGMRLAREVEQEVDELLDAGEDADTIVQPLTEVLR